MKYRLYQINPGRDRDRVKYLGLAVIGKYQASPDVNRSIYDPVYEGDHSADACKMVEETLNELYLRFNADLPDNFCGHRMSVSDVVEVIGENGAESSFWYCDNIGFKEIPFRPAMIRDNADRCVCCGEVIPEGRQVCPACEAGDVRT